MFFFGRFLLELRDVCAERGDLVLLDGGFLGEDGVQVGAEGAGGRGGEIEAACEGVVVLDAETTLCCGAG